VRWPSLALLILVSCGSKRDPAADPEAVPFVGDDGGGGGFGTAVDGGALAECAEETKDIFVISEENSLYSFHPPTLEFKSIGLLSCPTGGARPTSMAVDRKGIAWVRHSDGSIWKVDTRTVECQATSFVAPAEGSPFFQFAMGFSTSSKGGSNEELFLSDSSGLTGLGKLNTTSLKVNYVGSFTGPLAGKTAELTGTGDGKLYGFFVTEPAQVAEISKGTGNIINPKEMTNTSAGDGWAFSFYAGDF